MEDLQFAWACVKHVKSNAIAVAKDGRLLGVGSGQPNRVDSVRLALRKAGDLVKVFATQPCSLLSTTHTKALYLCL